MKEFKYTIDGKEYKVEIGEINAENVAEVTVNGCLLYTSDAADD